MWFDKRQLLDLNVCVSVLLNMARAALNLLFRIVFFLNDHVLNFTEISILFVCPCQLTQPRCVLILFDEMIRSVWSLQ